MLSNRSFFLNCFIDIMHEIIEEINMFLRNDLLFGGYE